MTTTNQRLAEKFSRRCAIEQALSLAFVEAKEAADAAGINEEDGGTCNLDSPAFRLAGVRDADAIIQKAAKFAGVVVSQFQWFGRQKWYWLHVATKGQGNRRARMSDAGDKVLRAWKDRIKGFEVCQYQQCD